MMVFQPECQEFHPVDHLLVDIDHLSLGFFLHQFAEEIIGIQMNAHHDVLVALLQGNWKGASSVHMHCVQKFVHYNKDVVVLFDGQ